MTTVWKDRMKKKTDRKFHAYCWKLTFIMPTSWLWNQYKKRKRKRQGDRSWPFEVKYYGVIQQTKKKMNYILRRYTYKNKFGVTEAEVKNIPHQALMWINPFQKKNRPTFCVFMCVYIRYRRTTNVKKEMNREKITLQNILTLSWERFVRENTNG